MVKKIVIVLFSLLLIMLVFSVFTQGGRIEIHHIPPDARFFIPIDESGLKKNRWYHFSTDAIDLAPLRQTLAASSSTTPLLSKRYDLRSSLKDKQTGEIFYIGYSGGSTESCYSFIKNEKNIICDDDKVNEFFHKINNSLESRYLTRFWAWLLHL